MKKPNPYDKAAVFRYHSELRERMCKECGTDRACPLCDERICVLCGSPLLGSFGCEPWPLAYTGRSCHQCDIEKVLPARGGLVGFCAEEFTRHYKESQAKLNQQRKQP
jgi:hypothetical protein